MANESPESTEVTTSVPEPNSVSSKNEDILQESRDESEQNLDSSPAATSSVWTHYKNLYWHHKKWSLPLTLLIVVLLLASIPWSRYKLAGLVIKKDYSVQVLDSTTHAAVSGALVSADGQKAITNGLGVAKLHLAAGPHSFLLSKKYYQSSSAKFIVPILKQKSTNAVQLIATGRQVKINVTNLINKKVLSNVAISIADISAKTDNSGSALVVVPAGKSSYTAKLSLIGYNDSSVTVAISDNQVKTNNYSMTPAGKIYYLSRLSGNLDVMKANLDGTSSEVVLAGTGSEQISQTELIESPDLKYVALLTRRSLADSGPELYVISTADDKLLTIDSSNSTMAIKGWSNDYLIYSVTRNDLPGWQPGLSKIKSYNAQTGKIITLDQSTGSDATSNSNEVYNNIIVAADKVVFSKYWSGDQSVLSGKQNTVQTVEADGQSHKTVASYDAASTTQQIYQYDPDSFYIAVDSNTDLTATTYYDYTIGSAPKQASPNPDRVYASYAFYLSPSGDQSFWSQPANGKNTLYLAAGDGSGKSVLANLSDFRAAGWYTDQYLLVTKNDSELFIMSRAGGTPIKVVDYQVTSVY